MSAARLTPVWLPAVIAPFGVLAEAITIPALLAGFPASWREATIELTTD